MTFVILGVDGPEGARLRPIHRPAHLRRLQDWWAKGKILLAGPLTDKTGSLIVVEAKSQEEAEAFAREDPYHVYGIFEKVTVHPFLQVFPPKPESAATTDRPFPQMEEP